MCQYNPRVDLVFKMLFGAAKNTDILLAFINSILDKDRQISTLKVQNPYRSGKSPQHKSVILDIHANDERGRQYHIEMQMNTEVSYNQRALYYWSQLYNQQLQKGESYKDLKKTISIHILNFDYFQQEAGYHHIFRLMHANSKRAYFEDMELHFIELERFRNTNPEILSALDRWATFLSGAEKYDRNTLPKALTKDPHVVRAFDVLDALNLSEDEKQLYEASQKWLMDEAVVLGNVAEKNHKRGREEGRKEGEAIGREKGEAIGREKGEAAMRQSLAQRLKARGEPDQAIAEVLGIDLRALEALVS